ncbi:PREDICTED: UV radiation resistance-associated gene protein-like isoform X2 [Priapulus caudatus]|nr:PREDICTED: UV radiation resistance-associated gene protein-like isoform X2 [Priapulus caudatus]
MLVIECTVQLPSLHYACSKLHKDGARYEKNTIIFGMFRGYYTDSKQTKKGVSDREDTELLSLVNDVSISKHSYDLTTMMRIRTVERAIVQTQCSSHKVLTSIEDRLRLYEEKEAMESEREKVAMRVNLLAEELKISASNLHSDREKLSRRKCQLKEKRITLADRFEQLSENEAALMEMRKCFRAARETYVKISAQLMVRRRQLISEVCEIYPILHIPGTKDYTICGVRLPNSEHFAGEDEIMIETALGNVAHMVLMLSKLLTVPLRYAIAYRGSHSIIRDHVTPKLSENDREFPLYSKGQDKVVFNYGVYLLNKNVAQLGFYLGMPTPDLRPTLYNLKSLLELTFGVVFEDTEQHMALCAEGTAGALTVRYSNHLPAAATRADHSAHELPSRLSPNFIRPDGMVQHIAQDQLFQTVADYRRMNSYESLDHISHNSSDGNEIAESSSTTGGAAKFEKCDDEAGSRSGQLANNSNCDAYPASTSNNICKANASELL